MVPPSIILLIVASKVLERIDWDKYLKRKILDKEEFITIRY